MKTPSDRLDKATEEQFPAIIFITLCKVVLTFASVDEFLHGVKIKLEHFFFAVPLRML